MEKSTHYLNMSLETILSTIKELEKKGVIDSSFAKATRNHQLAYAVFFMDEDPQQHGTSREEIQNRFPIMSEIKSKEDYDIFYAASLGTMIGPKVDQLDASLKDRPHERRRWTTSYKTLVTAMEQAGAQSVFPISEVKKNMGTNLEKKGGKFASMQFILPPSINKEGKIEEVTIASIAKVLVDDSEIKQEEAQRDLCMSLDYVLASAPVMSQFNKISVTPYCNRIFDQVVQNGSSEEKVWAAKNILRSLADFHVEATLRYASVAQGDPFEKAIKSARTREYGREEITSSFKESFLLRAYCTSLGEDSESLDNNQINVRLQELDQRDDVATLLSLYNETVATDLEGMQRFVSHGDTNPGNFFESPFEEGKYLLTDFSFKYAPIQFDLFKLIESLGLDETKKEELRLWYYDSALKNVMKEKGKKIDELLTREEYIRGLNLATIARGLNKSSWLWVKSTSNDQEIQREEAKIARDQYFALARHAISTHATESEDDRYAKLEEMILGFASSLEGTYDTTIDLPTHIKSEHVIIRSGFTEVRRHAAKYQKQAGEVRANGRETRREKEERVMGKFLSHWDIYDMSTSEVSSEGETLPYHQAIYKAATFFLLGPDGIKRDDIAPYSEDMDESLDRLVRGHYFGQSDFRRLVPQEQHADKKVLRNLTGLFTMYTAPILAGDTNYEKLDQSQIDSANAEADRLLADFFGNPDPNDPVGTVLHEIFERGRTKEEEVGSTNGSPFTYHTAEQPVISEVLSCMINGDRNYDDEIPAMTPHKAAYKLITDFVSETFDIDADSHIPYSPSMNLTLDKIIRGNYVDFADLEHIFTPDHANCREVQVVLTDHFGQLLAPILRSDEYRYLIMKPHSGPAQMRLEHKISDVAKSYAREFPGRLGSSFSRMIQSAESREDTNVSHSEAATELWLRGHDIPGAKGVLPSAIGINEFGLTYIDVARKQVPIASYGQADRQILELSTRGIYELAQRVVNGTGRTTMRDYSPLMDTVLNKWRTKRLHGKELGSLLKSTLEGQDSDFVDLVNGTFAANVVAFASANFVNMISKKEHYLRDGFDESAFLETANLETVLENDYDLPSLGINEGEDTNDTLTRTEILSYTSNKDAYVALRNVIVSETGSSLKPYNPRMDKILAKVRKNEILSESDLEEISNIPVESVDEDFLDQLHRKSEIYLIELAHAHKTGPEAVEKFHSSSNVADTASFLSEEDIRMVHEEISDILQPNLSKFEQIREYDGSQNTALVKYSKTLTVTPNIRKALVEETGHPIHRFMHKISPSMYRIGIFGAIASLAFPETVTDITSLPVEHVAQVSAGMGVFGLLSNYFNGGMNRAKQQKGWVAVAMNAAIAAVTVGMITTSSYFTLPNTSTITNDGVIEIVEQAKTNATSSQLHKEEEHKHELTPDEKKDVINRNRHAFHYNSTIASREKFDSDVYKVFMALDESKKNQVNSLLSSIDGAQLHKILADSDAERLISNTAREYGMNNVDWLSALYSVIDKNKLMSSCQIDNHVYMDGANNPCREDISKITQSNDFSDFILSHLLLGHRFNKYEIDVFSTSELFYTKQERLEAMAKARSEGSTDPRVEMWNYLPKVSTIKISIDEMIDQNSILKYTLPKNTPQEILPHVMAHYIALSRYHTSVRNKIAQNKNSDFFSSSIPSGKFSIIPVGTASMYDSCKSIKNDPDLVKRHLCREKIDKSMRKICDDRYKLISDFPIAQYGRKFVAMNPGKTYEIAKQNDNYRVTFTIQKQQGFPFLENKTFLSDGRLALPMYADTGSYESKVRIMDKNCVIELTQPIVITNGRISYLTSAKKE